MKKQQYILKQLLEIKNKHNAVPGISFQVRRGIIKDNNDNWEADRKNHPTIPVEFGNVKYAEQALDHLINGIHDSIYFWKKRVEEDIKTAQNILEESKLNTGTTTLTEKRKAHSSTE